MTRSKLILLLALVAILGVALPAWAGGPAGVGPPSCLVANPGKGALAVRATVALGIQSSIDALVPVDVTLRVERSGALAFLRFLFPELQVYGRTNEEVLCAILDNAGVRAALITALGLPPGRVFVITERSISRGETQSADQQIPGSGEPLGDPRASALADATFWAQ